MDLPGDAELCGMVRRGIRRGEREGAGTRAPDRAVLPPRGRVPLRAPPRRACRALHVPARETPPRLDGGFDGAAAVLVNLNVDVMWHRYYWTDAATMHLLVASAALLVEALYHANGGSLDPRSTATPSRRDSVLALAFSLLGGLALGGGSSARA